MESSRSVRADLFDPASLASLGHVEIVARWVVDGFLNGLHRSPKKGFSVEFAEYRAYQPGDDLRFIDWKIAARSKKWVVKQFEEETNLRATIILDVSRSMAWSSAPPVLSKQRYAEQLVAALSLLLIRQRDAVGFIRYDDKLRTIIPPKARTKQWRRILHALEEDGAGGVRLRRQVVLVEAAELGLGLVEEPETHAREPEERAARLRHQRRDRLEVAVSGRRVQRELVHERALPPDRPGALDVRSGVVLASSRAHDRSAGYTGRRE